MVWSFPNQCEIINSCISLAFEYQPHQVSEESWSRSTPGVPHRQLFVQGVKTVAPKAKSATVLFKELNQ